MNKKTKEFKEALVSRAADSGWSALIAESVIRKRKAKAKNRIRIFLASASAAASVALIFTFTQIRQQKSEAVYENFIAGQIKGVYQEVRSETEPMVKETSLNDAVFSYETDLLIDEALALR